MIRKGPGLFWFKSVAVGSACFGLASCTTYQPLALPEYSTLAADLSGFQINAVNPSGNSAPFNITDGLDLAEVATIAVLNNPELKSIRSGLQIADAQVFAAGLLPDPQLSAGLDQPKGNDSTLVDAYAVGLSYDIVPLIDRQARLEAARQGRKQVRLDLLWQEWQVMQQSRILAVRMQLEAVQLLLLKDMLKSYLLRYQRSSQALADGNVTLDINGTDLTALMDVLSQINQLEQTHNETQHSFNLLLGLDPDLPVEFSTLPSEIPPDAVDLQARLAELPQLRPDLLALQAGYASQEAKVRAAVLNQFPSVGISFNTARDNSDLKTNGFGISLNLPLFSGNRGNIRIEQATREQLREEYTERLAIAETDVSRLVQQQVIITQQANYLKTYLPTLETLVQSATHAYQQGDIDALTFLNMETTWVNKRLEQISLQQAGWENQIALETLLAIPVDSNIPLTTADAMLEQQP